MRADTFLAYTVDELGNFRAILQVKQLIMILYSERTHRTPESFAGVACGYRVGSHGSLFRGLSTTTEVKKYI